MTLLRTTKATNFQEISTTLLFRLSSAGKRRIETGIHSKKCGVTRFRCCANVIECTYINLDSIAYYTPRLYGIAYCF